MFFSESVAHGGVLDFLSRKETDDPEFTLWRFAKSPYLLRFVWSYVLYLPKAGLRRAHSESYFQFPTKEYLIKRVTIYFCLLPNRIMVIGGQSIWIVIA